MDKKGAESKSTLENVAEKGAKIGAAVVAGTGVAIGGLMAMANSTSETAAKWLELSQRTDIGIESLQKWGYAAEMSGADIGKLEVGMKKLSSAMVDAQNGGKASQKAFETLGVSMQELSKMTPEQAFEATMKKLADMPEGVQKNVIGNQLLGKSFTELKPLLAEGSSGMEALKQKAEEMGIVMSKDSVVAAESMGDELDNVKKDFEGVKNKIVLELIPKLTELFQWIQDKMPVIQSVAGGALDFIANTISFITDNSNILIPVLGGLFFAFSALKIVSVINGLIAAYTAFTTTAEGATIGLNVALMANPIGLVIAAIAALIAIGIALYQNWDIVKFKLIAIWEGMKNGASSAINGIIGFFTNLWDKASEIAGKIKTAFSNLFGGLKLPHIKISSGSLNPLKWFDEGFPKMSVDWYAKGGIFDKPTIFNTPYGLKGVGDAKSPEVVAPLHELKNMLGLNENNDSSYMLNQMNELIDAISNMSIVLNDGTLIGKLAAPMSKAINGLNNQSAMKYGISGGVIR